IFLNVSRRLCARIEYCDSLSDSGEAAERVPRRLQQSVRVWIRKRNRWREVAVGRVDDGSCLRITDRVLEIEKCRRPKDAVSAVNHSFVIQGVGKTEARSGPDRESIDGLCWIDVY